MPAKPAVSYSCIFEVLKNLEIFDSDGKLKKEKDVIWDEAVCRLSDIKKKNLYLYVLQDRHKILTQLHLTKRISCTKHVNHTASIPDQQLINKSANIFEIIDDLHRMKFSVTFDSVIKLISMEPFTVMYYLPEQLNLWKDLIQFSSMIYFTTSNDLIEDIRGENSIKRLSLHSFTVKIADIAIPLFQCISESTNLEFFHFFYREFARNQFEIPREISVGFSYVILEAMSRVFNGYPLDLYNFKCFKHLTNGSELPPTLIHVGTFEILQYVAQWECLQNYYLKKWYLCVMIYLCSINNFQTFTETLLDIFILSQISHENKSTHHIIVKIQEKLKSIFIIRIYENYLKYESTTNSLSLTKDDIVIDGNIKDTLSSYFRNLNKKALLECKNLDPVNDSLENNCYYCPDFAKKLLHLLGIFPIWTTMICSTNNDNYEPILQASLVLKSNLSAEDQTNVKSVSDFLQWHCEDLKTLCQKGRSIIAEAKSDLAYSSRKSKYYSYLLHEENWRGKNKIDEIEQSFESKNKPTPIVESADTDSTDNVSRNELQNSLRNESTLNSNFAMNDGPSLVGNDTAEFSGDMNSISISSFQNITSKLHSTLLENDFLKLPDIKKTDNDHYSFNENLQSHNSVVNLGSFEDQIQNVHSKSTSNKSNPDTAILISSTESVTLDHSYCILPSPALESAPKHKKKSKFIGPFEPIEIYYEQTNKKKCKDQIVRNAASLQPKIINSKKYNITNSSVFDAIAESFVFAYKNIKSFTNACDEKIKKIKNKGNEDFLTSVVQFAKFGNIIKFYKARALILFHYGIVENDVISCTDTVSTFFEKVLENNYSYLQNVTCSNCSYKEERIEKVISLKCETTYTIKNLNRNIENYFDCMKKRICNCQCVPDNNFQVGSFLAVDVESIKPTDFLHVLPSSLLVFGKKFVLVSVIALKTIQFSTLKEFQYIAYCRSLQDFWQERDGRKIKSLKKFSKVDISLMLYVMCE